jgi:hypothetical protein
MRSNQYSCREQPQATHFYTNSINISQHNSPCKGSQMLLLARACIKVQKYTGPPFLSAKTAVLYIVAGPYQACTVTAGT